MLLLRTLGSVALLEHTPTGEQHLDVQQKRLALLVFLVRRARGAYVRRDVLLALFWPEADEQHGRGVLRQALTAFRKQLGPDVLVTHGEEEVGLAPHLATCDASEFEEACRAGSHEAACALYQGDFLAGFHVTGVSPEFEQWVDAERDRLRRLARDAAWSMSGRAEAARNAAEALRWARHAVDLEPADEAGVARLIALLDRQGDRAGALAVYAALERRLADEFSAEPGPETRSLMQALRQRPTPAGMARPGEPSGSAPILPTYERGAGEAQPTAAGSAAPRPRSRLLVAGVIGGLTAVAFLLLLGPARFDAPVRLRRPGAVAVVPFRVHAAGGEMAWLGEGMVELLTMRLSGSEGLTVVEPGRVLGAWHDASHDDTGDASADMLRRVAEATEARTIVRGSVTGTVEHLILAAWVIEMPGGLPVAQASIEGPADSLPFLVDRLSGKLLGITTGLEGHRLASLEGVSPAAIRAFVAGRAAFRRGRPDLAAESYREAVTLDSTFAVAGLDLQRAAGWTKNEDDAALGRHVVRANRERLGAPDRALNEAMVRQWQDAPGMFGIWNAAVSAYPERPETWYGLADSYFHWGMLAGIDDALVRAEEAFRRGWALDSAANVGSALSGPLIAETMDHLVVLAHLRGDTAEVLRLTALLLATDSTSDLARKLGWHRAAVLGLAPRRAFWEHPAGGPKVIMGIVLFTLWTSVAADDHPRAALENRRRYEVHDPGFRSFARYFEAFNGGRPGDAPPADEVENGLPRALEVAAWWGGDSASAKRAAYQLGRLADGPLGAGGLAVRQQVDICRLGLWRAGGGDHAAAERAAQRLRAGRMPGLGRGDSLATAHHRDLCAGLLDASNAVTLGRPDAAMQVAIADSLSRTYIFQVCCGEGITDANLILARLWEQLGDRSSALRAVRRRSGGFLLGPLYLSTFLREEGRLAALTGDTTSAIRAYRHYLALRPHPEPVAQAEVQQVKRELAVLWPSQVARAE